MTFSVNILLTSILYCDSGRGFLKKTVLQVQHNASYRGYLYLVIFIHVPFFFGDGVYLLREAKRLFRDFPMFLPLLGSTLCLSSSICRFVRPLFVLAPHDSNVAV